MPVPSSNGSVLRWPAAADVLQQASHWALVQVQRHPDLVAVGVFGSYGRGTAAVGSDLDLLLILKTCAQPIWDRLRRWDTGALPQWNPRLAQVLQEETHWLTATPPPFNQPPAETDGRSDP
jgi:uncharacterized protein